MMSRVALPLRAWSAIPRIAAPRAMLATAAKRVGRPKGSTKDTKAKSKTATTKAKKAEKGKKADKGKKAEKGKKAKTSAAKTPKKKKAAKKVSVSKRAMMKLPPEARARSGYTIYSSAYLNDNKGTQLQKDIMRAAAAAWTALSPAEKGTYVQRAQTWNARAETVKAEFIASLTPEQVSEENRLRMAKEKSLKRSVNKLRDPRKPKGPLNVYMQYVKGHYATVSGSDTQERGKQLGESYRALSTAEKQRYASAAAADLQRYKREMEAYKSL